MIKGPNIMFKKVHVHKLYETFRWLINLLIANFCVFLVAAVWRGVSVIGFLF